jgi:hypothetical protein
MTTTAFTHRLALTAAAAVAALVLLFAHGATEAHAANGCGPNTTAGKLVPNGAPGVFNFTRPCNNHDRCYGTWTTPKNTCDTNFGREMRATCGSLNLACKAAASLYENAVRRLGGSAYANAQRGAGLARPLFLQIRTVPAATARIARFTWTYSNGIAASTQCLLDGRLAAAPCSPTPTFFVGPGRHTVTFIAANNAGRFSRAYTWVAR